MLLEVRKMTCNHCVRAVTEAIHGVHPAAAVEVDLGRGTVRIDGDVNADAAATAIREEGYEVRVLEP